MKQFCILALSVLGCGTIGCAQPESGASSSTGSTNNGTNNGTNGTGGHDLAAVDLSGAAVPDLAGVDFSGADLSMMMAANGDLAGTCDVVTQSGCGSTDKCVPASPTNVCVNSGGASAVPTAQLCGASMMPASSTDQCAKGDGCIGASDFNNANTINLCLEFCHKDADCSQATFAGGVAPRCDVTLMDTNAYDVCTVSCNPYAPADGNNGCPKGLACRYFVDDTRDKPAVFEFTDCGHYGAVAKDGDCTAHGTEDCAPGLICVTLTNGSTTTNTCKTVCRLPGNADCGGGQACQAFSGLTGAKFGACIP